MICFSVVSVLFGDGGNLKCPAFAKLMSAFIFRGNGEDTAKPD